MAYYPLAGGDKAAKEAVRPLVGLLGPKGVEDNLDILARIEPDADKIQMILMQVEKGLNTIQTSSLGRLFDAVAALIGLGAKNRFEAELPMALEAMITDGVEDSYPIKLTEGSGVVLESAPIVLGVLEDVRRGVSKGIVAARFHNSICEGLLELAKSARQRTELTTAALSGGVFCNRYLANRVIGRLQEEGFRVLWKKSVPVNDGGIALGQAAITAAMIEKRTTNEH